MIIIQTATGKEIECEFVSRSDVYEVLNIHTKAITPAEAYTIFGNPNETKELIKIEYNDSHPEDSYSKVIYRGFTECYMVKKSPIIIDPNCYMIWLNRPVQYDPGESYTDDEIQEGQNAIELLNIIFNND